MSQEMSELQNLQPEKRRLVYARFSFELTIGARAVWIDPLLTDSEKLEGLKWLNEIQHQVLHACHDSPNYSPSQLAKIIQGHIKHAEQIRGHVGACYRSALNHANGN